MKIMPWELALAMIMLPIGWLCLTTIWSRRDTWMRAAAIAALLLSIPLAIFATSEPLGWSKPAAWAWRLGDTKLRVLGHKLVINEAIYVYVDAPGSEPRALKFPWNDKTAQALQDAINESLRRGRKGALLEFAPSWDMNPPQFHPLPQPRTPMPKNTPEIENYERGA